MPKSHSLILLYACFCCCLVAQSVWLFATPWTIAHQAPVSMGLSRREYWSGLPLLTPGDLPRPRDRTCVPCLYPLSTRGSRASSWQNISPLISSPEGMPCVWQALDPLEKGSWRGRPSFSPEEPLAISFIRWHIGHVNNKFIFLLLVPREGLAVNPPSCFISHLRFYKNTLLFFLTGSLCTGGFILYFLLCFNGIILLTWDHLREYSHGTCSPAMWQYCC